jgi:mRNA interferase RelE/StbE
MPHTVEFLRSAAREFSFLPKSRQTQLTRRIDGLQENPLPPGVRKIEGADKLYRLRVGDYRILYEVDDHRKAVTIIKIGHRRDVYRNF